MLLYIESEKVAVFTKDRKNTCQLTTRVSKVLNSKKKDLE